MQAWLVPHIPEEAARVGCGAGSTAAVHQGFNVSWGNALKKDVCAVIQKAVKHSGSHASRMRVLVTGSKTYMGGCVSYPVLAFGRLSGNRKSSAWVSVCGASVCGM